jgi:hypothetical protein
VENTKFGFNAVSESVPSNYFGISGRTNTSGGSSSQPLLLHAACTDANNKPKARRRGGGKENISEKRGEWREPRNILSMI